ncbi:Uncharacterized protein FWK35_00014136 [Aphis craccivora]|uniref:Uncharacterized protein n=1 Tax=Aphis craccivora TaxID=307492 RepID=A0A6G0YR34_APHCR|nr:Uncharacterized protein FWK35_00014136 [Aphis craccivora]
MKGDGSGLNKSDNQGTTLGPGHAYLFPSPPANVLPQSSTTPLSVHFLSPRQRILLCGYVYVL